MQEDKMLLLFCRDENLGTFVYTNDLVLWLVKNGQDKLAVKFEEKVSRARTIMDKKKDDNKISFKTWTSNFNIK